MSKMLADEWKVLSDDQKQKYYMESEHLKSLHQLQHPDYKYDVESLNLKVFIDIFLNISDTVLELGKLPREEVVPHPLLQDLARAQAI